MKSSMKLTKKEIFSIPNILCYFRILLIPVFMISYINAKETRDYYFAAFIVLLSGLTDRPAFQHGHRAWKGHRPGSGQALASRYRHQPDDPH